MKKILFTALIIIISFSVTAEGKAEAAGLIDNKNININLTLADIPFNTQNGLYYPSMKQALELTNSAHDIGFFVVGKLTDGLIDITKTENLIIKGLVKGSGYGLYYMTSFYLPYGDGWVHEEYHRAVMKNKGIDSYNDIYNMNLFVDSIAVSHVKDEDLIRLKKESNPDLVRLHAAGYEAQNEEVLSADKKWFFGSKIMNEEMGYDIYFIQLINLLNNYFYLQICTTPKADQFTEEMERLEGANIEKRDFTGLDFTAWAYDLFRSNEPYENRGKHPSGIGIKRYIKNSDLTADEKKYLELQRDLSLVQYIEQCLNRVLQFDMAGGKTYFNLRHYMTSYGYTVNINMFYKSEEIKIITTLLNQNNHKNYFPGLDLQLIEYPVKAGGINLKISPRIMVWSQPRNQEFKTSEWQIGGLISIGTDFPISENAALTFEAEGKTAGWVASNVYLNENISARTGIKMRF